jgi:hypothetical protein
MKKKQRKSYIAAFKVKIALEAINGVPSGAGIDTTIN